MSHAKRITTYLRQVAHRYALVQLTQLVAGQSGSLVQEYRLDDVQIDDLASQIDGDIEQDANDVCGLCRYQLVAVEDGGRRGPRMVVRQRGSDELGGDASPEDPPNAAGLVGQALRHTEAAWQMTAQTIAACRGTLERDLERAHKRLEHLESTHFANLQLQEMLLSEQHERDQDAAAGERRAKQQDQLLQILGPILPALLQRFMAAKDAAARDAKRAASPQEAAPTVEEVDGEPVGFSSRTVSDFVATLSPEQLQALQSEGRTKAAFEALLRHINRGRAAPSEVSP